ncbi:UPF0175 family protein [Candidatus Micrarchaeota archaeon]|nr:UPF0175 family protein [Candidatus Micrarchaeota archaeon]
MGKTITARIDDKEMKDLKMIEEDEKLDRSAIVRRLLGKSIKEWKIEKALKHYQEKKITIGKVAEITGLTLREALAVASTKGISFQYTIKELQEDFREAIK